MKFYFEFNEHEYYGLITVSVDDNDFVTKPHKKAAEIYAEVIAGENAIQVLDEALPHERTEHYALATFVRGIHENNPTIRDLLKQFDETENDVLLIDSSFK